VRDPRAEGAAAEAGDIETGMEPEPDADSGRGGVGERERGGVGFVLPPSGPM
jgi:hypothetical protein